MIGFDVLVDTNVRIAFLCKPGIVSGILDGLAECVQ
jgi:hypothetical protein